MERPLETGFGGDALEVSKFFRLGLADNFGEGCAEENGVCSGLRDGPRDGDFDRRRENAGSHTETTRLDFRNEHNGNDEEDNGPGDGPLGEAKADGTVVIHGEKKAAPGEAPRVEIRSSDA